MELFLEIKKLILSNDFLKVFILIGVYAASAYFIFSFGKEVGRFIALLIK